MMKFSDFKEVGKEGEIKLPNNGHMALICFNPTKKDVKVSYGPVEEIVKPNGGFVTTRLHPTVYNGPDGKLIVIAAKGTKLAMINIQEI